MVGEQDWNTFLNGHPVFGLSKGLADSVSKGDVSLELSLSNLPQFTDAAPSADSSTPLGRRQVMAIKDSDVIVAVGSEIRMASLVENKAGGASTSGNGGKGYKTLHTPNVAFEIRQMALNPNSKFLAVAGVYQVAVIVLPRSSSTRLSSSLVDCKSIHIGSEYHNPTAPAAIAKIDWHPWGDGGTTLMVMTVDGKMREYDIAADTEEPQQVLSFVPERKSRGYVAEDDTEREVASFTIGKGKADWGPLTVYSVMKSGDIYAICPYMPKNAAIPTSYVHALECFVAAKQEFLLSTSVVGGSSSGLTNVYDYQHKFVTALLKQLPAGASTSRTVQMHPPTQIKNSPVRQGPFLLQPAPNPLEEGEDGNATDIVYLAFGGEDEEEGEGETERLGVVLVAYQEGRVDVFLDVEKVEARWERKHPTNELPMLAVYETVDLGIVEMLRQAEPADGSQSEILDLLKGNHPVFVQDSIRDETIYVYHAFGVHALQLGPLLQNLANALRDDISTDGNASLNDSLETAGNTAVIPVLTTFSKDRSSSQPVVAVAVPNDIYLTYSMFILTSALRTKVIPLPLQPEQPPASEELAHSLSRSTIPQGSLLLDSNEPPAYVSLLQDKFNPPQAMTRPLVAQAIMPPVKPPGVDGEFQLTPETLRYLAQTVERFAGQLHEITVGMRHADLRTQLQRQEVKRQLQKCTDVLELARKLKTDRQRRTEEKVKSVQEGLRVLLAKEERILGALMKKASPALSENETKWFQELKRMRAEIKGSSKYDQESLSARVAQLKREHERMLPNLKGLKEKEQRLSKKISYGSSGLGISQAFELGRRSNADLSRIEALQDDLLQLAERIDVALPRPPTSKAPVKEEEEES